MNILIAGDFAPVARLAKFMEEKRFPEVFPKDLCDVIQSADFSFVNFESPIAEEGDKPIPKCGPNLKCSMEAAEAVGYAGFTGVTLANNHILDYGAEGLFNTVRLCKGQGLSVVGAGDNLADAEKILYLEKGGETLAVINCCEHEFSIATATEPGANPLNPIRQFYQIKEAKANADHVLVIVHGGHEHFQLPSPRMVETYRFFIDAGADAVVNHHQHCYSGYETYHNSPIFYGIGNFCFDIDPQKKNTMWNDGFLVKLNFEKKVSSFSIHPYKQCDGFVGVHLLNDYSSFCHKINYFNEIITNFDKLAAATDKYYADCAYSIELVYTPYSNRILNKLYRMHLLPRIYNKQRFLQILNVSSCESHRDKQMAVLKMIINNQVNDK